jgi:hypothetical protein
MSVRKRRISHGKNLRSAAVVPVSLIEVDGEPPIQTVLLNSCITVERLKMIQKTH